MNQIDLPHVGRAVETQKSRLVEAAQRNRPSVASLVRQVQETKISDKLLTVGEFRFVLDSDNLRLQHPSFPTVRRINRHALRQMCERTALPMTYVNRLDVNTPWRRELLAHNLNTLFENSEFGAVNRSFLFRFVGEEVFGFLTRRFNRALASIPLLAGFLSACEEFQAVPFSGNTNILVHSLLALRLEPFEALPGQFMAFGMRWRHSDFGLGRVRVDACVYDLNRGTVIQLGESFSRVHLGSIIQEGDLEISAETAAKEVDAVVSATRDAVRSGISVEAITTYLEAIAEASKAELTATKIRSALATILQKAELAKVDAALEGQTTDLPPPNYSANGDVIPTKWWAANLLAWFAEKEEDTTRIEALQSKAGEFIVKPKED